ncbi:MAG: protease pro-enzyme activation domain-containing protein [Mycobacteriales bacterium]
MRKRVTFATVATATLALSAPTAALAAGPSRVDVPTAQPSWVAGATPTGDVAASTPVQVEVYLAERNADQAEALVQAISDPHSGQYGHYLSPEQYRSRFAATDTDVAKVRDWLSGAGLKVGAVPDNHHYVTATGTAAAAERAFGTSLRTYSHGGATVRAVAGQVSVPSGLSGLVIGVSGLADRSALTTTNHTTGLAKASTKAGAAPRAKAKATSGPQAPPPDGFRAGKPCSDYYGQKTNTSLPPAYGKEWPYAVCGYTPSQIQGAYGLTGAIRSGLTGRGVTVAITDAYAAPTILADANTYATRHGQAAFGSHQFNQVMPAGGFRFGYDDTVNGDQCGEQGWYGEETLDVEAVHAVAPGANVTYYASASCDDADLLATLENITDHRSADVVTNSWGSTGETNGALTQAYHQTFRQAAAEGIGMNFSSGDDGDDATVTDNGKPAVDLPASDPLVTAVGGTSIGIGRWNDYQYEVGWATGKSTLTNGAWDPAPPGVFWGGGGGGTSSLWNEPWYQRGIVPDRIATRNGGHKRAVPDVAMDGDPNTGFLVGETQTFPDGAYYDEYRIGGTSLSSPLFAGVLALADQASGHSHGFANPAIYSLAGLPVLHDVSDRSVHAEARVDYANSVDASGGLVTSLRTLQYPQSINVARGYDDMTGVGTPNGFGFLLLLGNLN